MSYKKSSAYLRTPPTEALFQAGTLKVQYQKGKTHAVIKIIESESTNVYVYGDELAALIEVLTDVKELVDFEKANSEQEQERSVASEAK